MPKSNQKIKTSCKNFRQNSLSNFRREQKRQVFTPKIRVFGVCRPRQKKRHHRIQKSAKSSGLNRNFVRRSAVFLCQPDSKNSHFVRSRHRRQFFDSRIFCSRNHRFCQNSSERVRQNFCRNSVVQNFDSARDDFCDFFFVRMEVNFIVQKNHFRVDFRQIPLPPAKIPVPSFDSGDEQNPHFLQKVVLFSISRVLFLKKFISSLASPRGFIGRTNFGRGGIDTARKNSATDLSAFWVLNSGVSRNRNAEHHLGQISPEPAGAGRIFSVPLSLPARREDGRCPQNRRSRGSDFPPRFKRGFFFEKSG